MRHGAGEAIFGLLGIYTLILFMSLVYFDDQRTWQDVPSMVTALGAASAVFFTYGKFSPPAFFPAFIRVVDSKTGAWKEERLLRLDLPADSLCPVFVVVHNVGITSWSNYRMTVTLEPQFEIHKEHWRVPASREWAWKTINPRIHKKPPQIQVQATNVLAVAEEQTARFIIKTPKQQGLFSVSVDLVVGDRLSEKHKKLWINVV